MPEDMDIYMKKIKQRADETDNVMGKIKADKMAELDKLRIDNEMEEVRARLEESRAKIRESQKTGQVLAPQQAYNLAELLFAGRPPEEIKQIINSLTEEEIHKFAYMASAMNNNKLSEFREYMRQPSTSMKEVVEAVKLGTEIAKPQQQGSISDIAKSMAEMFKTGVEIGRGQNQPQQPQQNSLETMKMYNDMFLKPVLDQLNSKDRELMTMRMNQLESKITAQVSPQEYIKQIKESANTLGLTGGGKTELDLKLLEMAQVERLENRRIDFATEERMQKREDDKEGVKQLYGLIGQVVGADGVVGKLASNLGSIAKTRLERGSSKSNNPNPEVDLSKIQTISCPKCAKPIRFLEGSTTVLCSNCDAVLGLQTQQQQAQQPQPQEQPSVTQPSETQAPPQASEPEKSTDASQPSDNQPNKTE